MKHQYFGDVNDYRKYGLLRTLQRETGLRIGVWWMLTPDDGRTDGKFTGYLEQAARWREYDPDLFDRLASVVPRRRSVVEVQECNLVPDSLFADAIVPDGMAARAESFASARQILRAADLVFLDPDNGLEIASCPPGRKGSSKYVLRREITELFADGHSLLIYQHFRREEREAFIRQLGASLQGDTGAPSVTCFRTANVAFFLLPQYAHEQSLGAAADRVGATWRSQIRLMRDCRP